MFQVITSQLRTNFLTQLLLLHADPRSIPARLAPDPRPTTSALSTLADPPPGPMPLGPVDAEYLGDSKDSCAGVMSSEDVQQPGAAVSATDPTCVTECQALARSHPWLACLLRAGDLNATDSDALLANPQVWIPLGL